MVAVYESYTIYSYKIVVQKNGVDFCNFSVFYVGEWSCCPKYWVPIPWLSTGWYTGTDWEGIWHPVW